MLYTEHVSGIIMPIIRSTVKDDKLHTVFCTGRADWTWGDEVDPVCTYCTPDDGQNNAWNMLSI
jgi:hypothetical protein